MLERCQRTTNVNPESRNTLNETVDDMSLTQRDYIIYILRLIAVSRRARLR